MCWGVRKISLLGMQFFFWLARDRGIAQARGVVGHRLPRGRLWMNPLQISMHLLSIILGPESGA